MLCPFKGRLFLEDVKQEMDLKLGSSVEISALSVLCCHRQIYVRKYIGVQAVIQLRIYTLRQFH